MAPDKDDNEEKFKRFLVGDVPGRLEEFVLFSNGVLVWLVEGEGLERDIAGSSVEETVESVCSLEGSSETDGSLLESFDRPYFVAAVRKPGCGKGLGGGTVGKFIMTVANEQGYSGGAMSGLATSALAGIPGTAGIWDIGS